MIEREDLHVLYTVLDMLSYEEAWKRFLENPDQLDNSQEEFIGEVRGHKLDLFGP